MRNYVLCFLFLLLIQAVAALGIGVSPDRLLFENVSMGKMYSRQLLVFNPTNEERSCWTEIPEYQKWFTIECPDNCSIAPMGRIECRIELKILEAIKEDNYMTSLSVGLSGESQSGLAIVPETKIPITITTQPTAANRKQNLLTGNAIIEANSRIWVIPIVLVILFMLYLLIDYWRKKRKS
ncbi:hypothetical protein HZB01_03065 [Candidatus Woesearchaeota archaeon]|nr:hypothetical protein [Candidatus Woesearchaeota archaeon]